jgi:L-ascorbate metabolism protein UlaG (beta-lactamase superfamily)
LDSKPVWIALATIVLLASSAARAEIEVRWLGVAGFSFTAGADTLLHDPFFTRPSAWDTLTSWYRADASVIDPLLAADGPAPELARARGILIGHSHYDHLGDAPYLAQRTGASIHGSGTTARIAQGYGVPSERTPIVNPGDVFDVGAFAVRVVESRHAKVILGRVPLTGTLEEVPETPIHALSFKLGDARLYLVEHRPSGLRILTTSSADRHAPALDALRAEGVSVDLLLTATQGRDADYARDLVAAVRPRIVVPHHFDSFTTPLASEAADAASDPEDLAAFEAEIQAAAAALGLATEVRRLSRFETLTLEPAR